MIDRSRIAAALLAKCRKVMTGREIEICERAKSGQLDECELHQVPESREETFIEREERNLLLEMAREDIRIFKSLEIQFAREIGEWKGALA